jgi:hypothetical protein
MLPPAFFLYHQKGTPWQVMLICDPLISEAAADHLLKNFQQQKIAFNSLLLHVPFKGALKELIVYQKDFANMYLYPHFFAPVIQLNSDYMLLENGAIIARNVYDENYCKTLPTLLMNHAVNDDSCSIINWLSTIDWNLFYEYELCWINQVCIQLTHKQKRSCLIARYDQLLTMTMCMQAEQLLATLKYQGRKNIVADLRFEDRIIIYDKKGEHEEGIIFS